MQRVLLECIRRQGFFEISDDDATTFKALDSTYGRDTSNVYVNGAPLADADTASFEVLDYPISDDQTNFELLDGGLAKDSHVVYWSDGSVLSDDPEHFASISSADHYLFTKDGQTVHVNGNPIPDADPATFQLLHGAYARDDRRVFYFADQIVDADSGIVPIARRPVRKRLRTRLLDG